MLTIRRELRPAAVELDVSMSVYHGGSSAIVRSGAEYSPTMSAAATIQYIGKPAMEYFKQPLYLPLWVSSRNTRASQLLRDAMSLAATKAVRQAVASVPLSWNELIAVESHPQVDLLRSRRALTLSDLVQRLVNSGRKTPLSQAP